jgi:PucR C-terminal helix-turn-helix domain/GGDEF-like domain
MILGVPGRERGENSPACLCAPDTKGMGETTCNGAWGGDPESNPDSYGRRPSCSLTWSTAAQTAGCGATAWVTAMACAAARQALSESLEREGRPAGADAVRAAAEACIEAIMCRLHADPPPETIAVPGEVLAAARTAVRHEIPLHCMLRAVWIAGAGTRERTLAGQPYEGNACGHTVHGNRVVRSVLACVETFSTRIAQAYTEDEELRVGGVSAGCVQVLENILAGLPVDHRDAEGVTGVAFAHHHLSAVLTASAGSGNATALLPRFAHELAEALGGTRPLVVPAGPVSLRMWTSWRLPPDQGLVAGLRKVLSPPLGVRVSIGPVAPGMGGFRRSQLGAQAAERMASRWRASWLCEYRDVAVASLLAKDPREARWFIEETLGDLASHDPWFAELRETLRLYLAFGRSRTHAAKGLHVARNTVAYRVEKAVKLLGRPIPHDPLEVRLALELARVLPVGP